MCSVSGCPQDKAYAVVRGGKLMRVTFSRSLADYIVSQTGDRVFRVSFYTGKKLDPGHVSESGLYAVAKKSSGWVLRITMFHELAESWRHESREVYECRIVSLKEAAE